MKLTVKDKLKIAKEHGSTCIALTNVLYSSLARMVDYVLPVCAGPEIAVASTKAYVCQLSALFLFASALADKNIKNSLDEIEEMSNSLLDFQNVAYDFSMIASSFFRVFSSTLSCSM